ncbi:LysR substrate-binding domain-containing protein [Cognatishimia sp. SS12]|uniref:LysR substrate-binding domain-containing protein n=1 Tax=Cognatishimia sp. SS12 TaxID=2979465 RepID=UPI00233073EE|nr:LysR substrate-binding domain-containing protein [Cognatishimia sp. SS12]MDC0737102.1 LysR substrate-binding domain-containing protein [Cognatishimia sp. SS12]
MNVTLKHLTYFAALAEHRHFGRAAEACHVSQPALSVQIRDLEQALNGPLVERRTRDVTLTPFGRQTLAAAQRILQEIEALERAARWRKGLAGSLSLGMIPTIAPYLLPGALAALRARDISLDVHLREGKTERLISLLHAGHLDAAVMALPSGGEGLVDIPLFEDRFLLAGTPAQLKALDHASDGLHPEALQPHRLMLLEDGHCLTDQALAVCGRGRGHSQIDMGASSLPTLTRLVAAGFGLTLLPELSIADEQSATPEIALRRFADPQPARHIGLVRRAGVSDAGWFDALAAVLQDVGQALVAQTR